MSLILPFETEIVALDRELAQVPPDDPRRAKLQARLDALERRVYPHLAAYDQFLLSGSPTRPKTLDYIAHIFQDVRL